MPEMKRKKVVRKKVVKKVKREQSAMDQYEDADGEYPPEENAGTLAVRWGIRAIVVLALAIAAYKIVPPYLQAQKAQPVWDEGIEAFNAKDYDKAIAKLTEAKDMAPDWPEIHKSFPVEIAKVYYNKGFDLKQNGDVAKARDCFLKVVEFDKEQAVKKGVYLAIAQCYYRERDMHKALQYAKLEVDSNGSEAKTAQGMVKQIAEKIANGE